MSLGLLSVLILFTIGLTIISTPVNVSGQFEGDLVQSFEDCFNGFDDDGDTWIDGDDADCASATPTFEDCFNGLDDDGDGFFDGDDADCPAVTAEPEPEPEPQPEPQEEQAIPEPILPPEEVCDNGVDDNGDGQVDEGCAPPPPPPEEVCDNGVDDDGDGFVDEDCPVPEPEPEPQLPPPEEVCDNAVDDDGDGSIDEDCPVPEPEPAIPPEDCGDNIDNNGDGQTDEGCSAPASPAPAEVCDNAVDDDGDGLVDGEDIDCPPSTMQSPCPDSSNMSGCPPTAKVFPPVIDPCENNGTDCPPTGVQPPVIDNPTAQYTDCPNNATITHCLPPDDVPLIDFTENVAPVADAGEDQEVNENSLVTLDGTASHDSDGNITSYSWVQTDGDELVTISEADSSNPSIYLPNVASDLNLAFELTVFDNFGYGTSDDVTIVVKDVDDTVPLPLNGSISLEPIPDTLDAGTVYTFKGNLYLDGISDYEGRYIQIIDASGKSEDLLSFGTTDENGVFIAEWTAQPRDIDYNIYALYEGENETLIRSDTYKVAIAPTELRLENLTAIPILGPYDTTIREPYIDLAFNSYLKNEINVYIVYSDEQSEKYVSVSQNAIRHWEQILKTSSGNANAWNFRIYTSQDFPNLNSETVMKGLRFYPINILVDLRNDKDMEYCDKGTRGLAHISYLDRLLMSTIKIEVFTGCNGQNWPGSNQEQDIEVARFTSHEFGHALGLGHTWHEKKRYDV